MPKYTYNEHSKLSSHPVWYDAPRALYADFVTRSLAANDETKMAALGGTAGSENRLTSFLKGQKHYLPKQKNTFMYSVHLLGTYTE